MPLAFPGCPVWSTASSSLPPMFPRPNAPLSRDGVLPPLNDWTAFSSRSSLAYAATVAQPSTLRHPEPRQQLVRVVLSRPVPARPEAAVPSPDPSRAQRRPHRRLALLHAGTAPGEHQRAPRRFACLGQHVKRLTGWRHPAGPAVPVAPAGLTHTAAPRSNWSQVARRTSTCRTAVRAVHQCPVSSRARTDRRRSAPARQPRSDQDTASQ